MYLPSQLPIHMLLLLVTLLEPRHQTSNIRIDCVARFSSWLEWIDLDLLLVVSPNKGRYSVD